MKEFSQDNTDLHWKQQSKAGVFAGPCCLSSAHLMLQGCSSWGERFIPRVMSCSKLPWTSISSQASCLLSSLSSVLRLAGIAWKGHSHKTLRLVFRKTSRFDSQPQCCSDAATHLHLQHGKSRKVLRGQHCLGGHRGPLPPGAQLSSC